MGSGMSLVTACSFSLNGAVAMAALQRPAPPPPQRIESDRPIRAGCCDMQSAVITALGRQDSGGGGGTIHRQGPNKIHLQTNTLRAPGGSVCFEDATSSSFHYMWHLPSGAVSSDTNSGGSANYNIQGALGTYHTQAGRLSGIILRLRSSSPVTRRARCFAIIRRTFVSLVKSV